MSRVHSLLPALLVVSGCTAGTIDGQLDRAPEADAAVADAAAIAKRAFEGAVQPLLEGFCTGCHGSAGSIGFLAPNPDMHTSVMSWPTLADVVKPSQSRLITKGAHDGPAWTPEQRAPIVAWLALEAEAAGVEVEDEPETAAFDLVVGLNNVDLAQIGLPGSAVSFRLEKLQVGLYISELMVHAGTGGVRLEHPLFVTWEQDTATPDPVDRFADIDLSVEADDQQMIGGGTLVLVNVAPDAQMSLHFATAQTADDAPTPTPEGCKDIAAFTANAQPSLESGCASCHAGGNAAATSATDMSRLGDLTPQGQATACGQILSRVNLAAPLNSGIFIAPDPGSGAGHPFKFGGNATSFSNFRDVLLVWINAENAAP